MNLHDLRNAIYAVLNESTSAEDRLTRVQAMLEQWRRNPGPSSRDSMMAYEELADHIQRKLEGVDAAYDPAHDQQLHSRLDHFFWVSRPHAHAVPESPAKREVEVVTPLGGSVLFVEDERDLAAAFTREFQEYWDHRQSSRFRLTFEPFVPDRDETADEFRQRLMRRLAIDVSDPVDIRPTDQDSRGPPVLAVLFDRTLISDSGAVFDYDGLELARMVRRRRPNMTLAMLSGRSMERLIADAGCDGDPFDHTVFKPDHRERVVELMHWLAWRLEQRYKTPFWDGLRRFTATPVSTFHAMANARARAASKSSVIRDFTDFYGEHYFLAETSATLEPLDSLLHPTGSIKEAQESAAAAFGALETFFVTNGTTTSNKIVVQGTLSPGDVVLVDRNCHISHHHAIALAGAHPHYLEPLRFDAYGLAGPVHPDIIALRLLLSIADAGRDPHRLPRALLITNPTFDGFLVRPSEVVRLVRACFREAAAAIRDEALGAAIHEVMDEFVYVFDEAWFAYGRFHPAFIDFSAAGSIEHLKGDEANRPERLRVYATQSTHKSLSAFRQASMIHTWDRRLASDRPAREKFLQAFLANTSTSPHSGLLASLDIARRQVEIEGFRRVDEALTLAACFRSAVEGGIGSGDQSIRVVDPESMWDAAALPVAQYELMLSELSSQAREQPWLREAAQRILSATSGRRWGRITRSSIAVRTTLLKAAGLEPSPPAEDASPEDAAPATTIDITRLTIRVPESSSGAELKRRLLAHNIQINKYSRNTVLAMVTIGTTATGVVTLKRGLAEIGQELRARPASAARVVSDSVPAFTKILDTPKDGRRNDLGYYYHNIGRHAQIERTLSELLTEIGDPSHVCCAAGFVVPYPPGYPVLVPGQVVDRSAVQFLQEVSRLGEVHGLHHGRLLVYRFARHDAPTGA